MDECLELANRFLQQFPKMRSRETLAKKAYCVGLAKLCQQFILMLDKFDNAPEVVSYRFDSVPKTVTEQN